MSLIKNKNIFNSYNVKDKYIAGIMLKGHEVKAIREKKVSFEGAYVQIIEHEPYIINLHIGTYTHQSQQINPEQESRPKKLLLTKNELKKLERAIQEKGVTIVPLTLFLQKNMIKLELGIAKGLKKYEKKQLEKEKQVKKDLDIASKEYRIRM